MRLIEASKKSRPICTRRTDRDEQSHWQSPGFHHPADYVIAVPANRTADVQQQLRHYSMAAEILSEITSVGWKCPAPGTAPSGGWWHTPGKTHWSHRVALRANAKQFALNGVDMVAGSSFSLITSSSAASKRWRGRDGQR